MIHFTEEELTQLKELCRIECSKEEDEKLVENLRKILNHIEQLQELHTEEVVSCNYVLQDMQTTVTREDKPGSVIDRDAFLSNAPDHIGGMIRVPPVIKQVP
jgi:aspartyl-tRNA(Asn)/glutamyl-tRNA(Gln) amidotransferase subunit C